MQALTPVPSALAGYIAAGAGTAAFVVGVVLLRAACQRAAPIRLFQTAGGWGFLGLGFFLWGWDAGTDRSIALAALALCLVAYAVVGVSVQVRTRRARASGQRHVAQDPLTRPSRPWRIAARILLAGPLSLIFGLALGLLLARRVPVAVVDALMLGGLLAPAAFAAAMAWSLTDERLARVAIGLGVASLLMTGLAQWPI